MENFSFRSSLDSDKGPSSFFIPTPSYVDPSLKLENFASPLFGPQSFARNRRSSFEAPGFASFFKEEDHDHIKQENFILDGPNFGQQPHADHGFDMPFSTKPQDYAVDFYRINRSRGPSFHLGGGRKTSEDFFAHGFDLLNSLNRSQEPHQRERAFSIEGLDNQMQGLLDFRMNPISNMLAGNFMSQFDNNPLFNKLPASQEDKKIEEPVLSTKQQQNSNEKENEKAEDYEPQGKKKRKLNNAQEVPGVQVNGVSATVALKKSASEIQKEKKQSKTAKNKKNNNEKGHEAEQVKSEADDKSTIASSVNVSPNPKKETIQGLLNGTTAILNSLGSFKKPETAQELFGGLNLSAEVEEYINNSKIFNQIRAPMVKKIGTLTVEERKIKVEKYLEKRKKRTWNKKVNYDCRKQVADNRLRIKGRFVTKEQAFSMLEALGIYPDPEKITNAEIKELLSDKIGALSQKKKAESLKQKQSVKEENPFPSFEGSDLNSFGFHDVFGTDSGLRS